MNEPDRLAAFVALVRELRALGAVRVRDGGLEAAFEAPPPVPETSRPLPDARLAAAAAYLNDMAEELS